MAKDEFEILRKVWPDGNRYQDFFRVAAACWMKNHMSMERHRRLMLKKLERGDITLSEYDLVEQAVKELQEFIRLSKAQDG